MLVVVLGGPVGHLDDQAAGLLDQQRQREVAGDRVRVDGEAQQVQPVLEVGLPDGGVPLHLGGAQDVVDQHVQRPLLVADALHQRRHLVGDEVVDLDRDAAAARGVDQLGGLLDRLRPVHLRPLGVVVRPVQYTVAPAAPSWTAIPRPAPRVAPATSATRPCSGCSGAVMPAAPRRRCWRRQVPCCGAGTRSFS